MNNLENFNVNELKPSEQVITNGGKLSVNQERAIAFVFFGLFGLAVYELSRNQCN